MFIVISSSKLFHYGLRSGMSDDLPEFVRSMTFRDAKLSFAHHPHTSYLYGVVSYSYQLPDNIIAKFNLADLNKSLDAVHWDMFVGFAKQRKATGMSLRDFQEQYLLSSSPKVKQNPIFINKPSSPYVYQQLKRHTHYKDNFQGLQEFWNSL